MFLEDFELSKEPLLLLIRVCAADPAALPVCPPPAPIHPQRWPSIPKSSCGKDQTPVSGRDRGAPGSLPLLMERWVGTAHAATRDFQGSPGPPLSVCPVRSSSPRKGNAHMVTTAIAADAGLPWIALIWPDT